MVAKTALRLNEKRNKSIYGLVVKNRRKKKKLTSTAITLYASVSDNAPGNESRLPRILGLSAPPPPPIAVVGDGRGTDDIERHRGDEAALRISDLDR